jgi:hypothetical protein
MLCLFFFVVLAMAVDFATRESGEVKAIIVARSETIPARKGISVSTTKSKEILMKTTAFLFLGLMMFLPGQVLAFGLIVQGEGRLALDPDNLHTAGSFDFDGDGLPNIVQEAGNNFQVIGLDGSLLWSASIDTLEICSDCTGENGSWDLNFEGFFMVEPGEYNAVISYSYNDWNMGRYLNGTLVVSLGDGTIRYQMDDLYLYAGVDLDGDDIHELAFYRNNGAATTTWEIWGHNGVSEVQSVPRSRLRVAQNRPNPFNPQTTVDFELAEAGPTRVEIHDAVGHLVFDRPLGALPAGVHQFKWTGVDRRGRRVASGTYIVTVVSGDQRQARKMMLLK